MYGKDEMDNSKFVLGLVTGLLFAMLFALLVARGPAPAHAQSNTHMERISDALENISRTLRSMERKMK